MINQADVPPIAAVPVASPRDQALFNGEQHRRAAEIAASRVPVRFLRDHQEGDFGGWMKGEIAGFDPGVADRLERSGVVTRDLSYKPPVETAPAKGEDANGNVAVIFRKPFENYVPGDKAGFPSDRARWLTAKGLAEPVDMTPIRRTLASIRAAILGR